MDGKHFIEIGGKLIDYFQILELVEVSPGFEPVGRITFLVKLDNNQLNKIDLKDRLRVYTKEKTILMGYVDEVTYSNFYATFRCEGYKRSFRSTKVAVEFLPNLKEIPLKAFWFMARLFNEPENIVMDPKMITQADFKDRDYVVIMPIRNLELNQKIQVLDVLFTNSLEPEEKNLINSSQTFKIDTDWSDNIPKARIKIRADNFYDAIMMGYKKILAVVKLISFRNDLSFVFYQDAKKMEFKNSLFYSRLDPMMKVFSKELCSNHSMFYNLKPQDRTVWKSEEISDDYFTPLKDFETNLSHPNQSDKQNPIFLSIQSLADSIQTDDPISKLIIVWNALEFAMSGLPCPAEFSRNEIRTIKNQITMLLKKLNDDGVMNLTEKKIEIVNSKLDHLNEAPIMESIKRYLIENQIPFDDNEMSIIKETREKRNDIQHGGENVIVKEEELEKLRSLVERILLKRVCLRH